MSDRPPRGADTADRSDRTCPAAPRHRLLPLILFLVFLEALALVWAVASPVNGVPDERAHVVYAWGVASGEALTQPVGVRSVEPEPEAAAVAGEGRAPTVVVSLPAEMLRMIDHRCYAFDGSVAATDCNDDLAPVARDGEQVLAVTYMARYPVAYYLPIGALMHLGHAAGLSGPSVLLLARVASGTWTVLLLALAVVALSRRLPGQVVVTGTLLAVAPMALFVSSAVNPNGLEVAAAVLVAAGVVVVRMDTAGARAPDRVALLGLALGAPVLALVRPLSVVWLGLLLLALLVPVRVPADARRVLPVRRLHPVLVLWSAAWVVVGLGWLVWSTLARGVRSTESVTATWATVPPGERVLLILLRYSGNALDAVGTFGWLDTPLPGGAVVAWLVAVLGLLTVLVVGEDRRAPNALHVAGLVLLGGLCAVAAHTYLTGFGWQPRYVLPVLAAALVVALGSAEGRTWATRVLLACGVVAVTVHVVSPLWTYGRFRWGFVQDSGYFPPAPLPRPLPAEAAWVPVLGPEAMVAAAGLAALVGVTALVLAYRWSGAGVSAPVRGAPAGSGRSRS